ncbi:LIM and SH3 domain protein 1 [Microtus ochrogaster]|uniref:LIM and SH3 domain protein 1 n=1 Tax=Microtus ochrogaster TaxID=79684 RepID=A0A8J6GB83_MICOH|nr:LIM and SH3 domain protein 1 [Microtus ochrogaster]
MQDLGNPHPSLFQNHKPYLSWCGKIMYPTEKVNCLNKFWHKAYFHCEIYKMTLNMKNYKDYEKKPYCNDTIVNVQQIGMLPANYMEAI